MSSTGHVRPPLGRHHNEISPLYQFISEGIIPPEIQHLDERLEPKVSRGVDRTEETGLTGILRNWAVEGFILGTGTDKGVYLWACYTQREPFSFSCNCCGVLAKKTDQIPIDDLCAPCRRRVDLLPAQARTVWSVTMNRRDKSSSHDISTAVHRRMIGHSGAFVRRRPWLGGQGHQRQLVANRRLPSPFGSLVPRREG